MTDAPPQAVVDLAEQRRAARAARDFAASDALREQIAAAGWIVTDTPDGYGFAPKPPYAVFGSLADVGAAATVIPQARIGVHLLVDGWPADVHTCVEALIEHTDAIVIALDCANVDGAGDALHELACAHPDRVVELHVSQPLGTVGWAKATTALIALDPSPVHVVMDISSVVTGDALSPLADAIGDGVVAAGWQGADVDLGDEWRSVVAAGPGEVDVLLGYLMAMQREAAVATPPHPKATFYRNADLEWSLMLRAAGGRLVVPSADLPVRQDRHHGYHDSDPEMRDRESKKTYDRILQFRRRPEILRPRD